MGNIGGEGRGRGPQEQRPHACLKRGRCLGFGAQAVGSSASTRPEHKPHHAHVLSPAHATCSCRTPFPAAVHPLSYIG